MAFRAAASAAMPVPRVRQLRDAQKSGGSQSANISSVNRRSNIVPPDRSMNETEKRKNDSHDGEDGKALLA